MPPPNATISFTIGPPPRDTYFIIVTGSMNPAIHHAHWYRTIGAIDEAELQTALKNPANATGALVSQIQFGTLPIIITCQPNQWLIRSGDASLWARMINIAALVFQKLNETPVNGYGLAVQRHVDTESTDVKEILAKSIVGLDLGFPNAKSTESNLLLKIIEDDYNVTLTVQASLLSEKAIFVAYHALYPVPQVQGQYFDVGVLMSGRFEKFSSDSTHFIKVVVEKMNARIEKSMDND